MSSKTPIRAVFNDSNVATGLAELQSGEFIPLSHGGLGASLSIGSAGQVLKVNSGASALEFGNVEAIVNIDGATNLESATLAAGDKILLSDGGTEGRVLLSQLDTLFSGTSKTLTNKTINASNNTISNITNSMLSGSAGITNANLANSAVTIGTTSISLGASNTTIAGISNLTAGGINITGNSITSADSSIIEMGEGLSVTGDLTVSGNMTISGTTTTLETTNSVISDKLIELANGTSGTPSGDAGLVIERGSSDNAFIGFDESADKFIVGTGSFTGSTTGNLTISTGTLVANLQGNVTGDVTGNADSATALETARTIAGQSFDGTGNITIASTDLSNTSAIALLTSTQTLTNKTLTSPVINSPTGDFIKIAGTNFTNSLLIGHATTGTLDAAENNTGVGIGALDALTSGDNNVAVGHNAGTAITSGGFNVLMGGSAGESITTTFSTTAIGNSSFKSANQNNNTGVGVSSGLFTTGGDNTAIGKGAGQGSSGSSSYTDVALLGFEAGKALTTGSHNILLGSKAGDNITTGSGNVLIGSGIDAAAVDSARTLKIAGYDGSTTTTWISGDSSGNVTIAGDLTISGDDLTMATNTSGAALIADGTNFNPVVISGDISIGTTGTAAIGSGVIVNADVSSSAAIAFSKMADLTASRALVSDGSGDVSVSDVTSTEIGYLDGVSSAIQTQLDNKASNAFAIAQAVALG